MSASPPLPRSDPPHLLDAAYFAGLVLASPYWLLKPSARKKVLLALRDRMGSPPPSPPPSSPTSPPAPFHNSTVAPSPTATPAHGRRPVTVLIHSVSLGEINATRSLVEELLARQSDLRIVVTSTTTTGFARAQEVYGAHPRITVDRYPLDLTHAVARLLDRHRPDAVVLMELELWPNFLRICRRRDTPVLVVNGRLTTHSLSRYRLIGPLARSMMRSLTLVCAQDDTYRQRFVAVGADPARVVVTGNMKFDTAQFSVPPEKVEALRVALGLSPGEALLVCGSTGPGEEELLLRVYRTLLNEHPGLRLALVPRKPERFDEVAALVESHNFPLLRRSQTLPTSVSPPPDTARPVLLGDTLGELRHFYALATVVFVGRSLVDLGPRQHGSDMIEPAALARPVIVGPHTHNFADAMHLLRAHRAVVEVGTETGLTNEVHALLADAAARDRLGEAARQTVLEGRGATTRHADRILNLLPAPGAAGQ